MKNNYKNLWKLYLKEEKDLNIQEFTPKDTLNPKIWDGERLKDDIKEKLMQIANDFFEKMTLEGIEIDDITITGSMANYNWTNLSDIDLHILVDMRKIDENTDLVKEFFNARSSIWNKIHQIKIKGHEVEVYVQDLSESHYSTGVFSLKNNDWLAKPEKKSVNIDENAVIKKAISLIDQIERAEDMLNDENYVAAHEYSTKIREKIKKFRQSGLEMGGEFSNENLSFKLLRKTGYLGILRDVINLSYDKKMSLNGNFVKKLRIFVRKSAKIDENMPLKELIQLENFQKSVKRRHFRMKKRLVGLGNQKNKPPYSKKPTYKRTLSAPAGFGGS
jgi:predicted nucleotidyltransferase